MRLPKSWAVRIATVGAAAAIAVTGATAAANASTAAPAHVHHFATHLAISNSTPVLHANGTTTSVIDGRLTHGGFGIRGFKVVLEREGAHGYWHVVQHATTRLHGHVFFTVHVGKKAASFRLLFRQTRNWARSTSLVDTIAPATAS
jgi:hypothetical protein